MSDTLDLHDTFEHTLETLGEQSTCGLRNLLREMLGGADRIAGVRRLNARVFRIEIADGMPWRTVILKRMEAAVAQRNQLVAERWLPALGLEHCCARLLGVAAERIGDCVWHVYEDLGDETLAVHSDPVRIRATVDLVAALHTRAARHLVLPEIRRYSSNRGHQYFIENVRDAIDALEVLAVSGIETPPEFAGVPNRLHDRLTALLADAPRRARVAEEAAGPDTLLHGDLWPINIFVEANGLQVRLVDWDRLAVGPFTYDLSTLLFRLPGAARQEILDRYRDGVAQAGWRLASPAHLDILFDTAECARYANTVIWPVKALLEDRADWGFPQLADIERWFLDLESENLN